MQQEDNKEKTNFGGNFAKKFIVEVGNFQLYFFYAFKICNFLNFCLIENCDQNNF